MISLFEVLKVGVLVTIQDMGRKNFRHMGIPVSGAMDQLAYQIGNILLGNKRDVASIEVAMGGTILKVCHDVDVVITGADLSPTINGQKIPMYRVIRLKQNDILTFHGAKSGVYAYIVVPDGICSKVDFESQSSYVLAKLGTVILKGMIIHGYHNEKRDLIGLNYEWQPNYSNRKVVHYIKSSHFNLLPADLINELSTNLLIGTSNRMGMYLSTNEKINQEFNANILSEGTTFGTIQILPSGQPIILLADCQTTGGYVTLGTIIHSDLTILSQAKQGDYIKLVAIDIESARNRNIEYERFLKHLLLDRQNIIKERSS
ncbi:biotin-dependent carboxyltransferase family protein [Gottfriedia solisilvae]|uniref:Allophanate hydrolase n=1 Tax=Gottfriedia solisilvae TaxID=1516104 RepID=A0A8J3AF67_9BACI|nr:biotin-dependent carboxyltransferase family protein [Gottfriedia solisilvae]GGI13257.1 allophanate hydrolase [Gottfriedia solisilvae]